jgi:hypothetical protein
MGWKVAFEPDSSRLRLYASDSWIVYAWYRSKISPKINITYYISHSQMINGRRHARQDHGQIPLEKTTRTEHGGRRRSEELNGGAVPEGVRVRGEVAGGVPGGPAGDRLLGGVDAAHSLGTERGGERRSEAWAREVLVRIGWAWDLLV